MNTLLIIMTIVIAIVLIIFLMLAFSLIKRTNENNKLIIRLEDKNKELEIIKSRNSDLINQLKLEKHKNETQASDIMEDLNKIFDVRKEELERCINTIKSKYTVSNKNKAILLKLLAFFLIMHSEEININNLSKNKRPIKENAIIIESYNLSKDVDKYSSKDVAEAILTLILYQKK